MQYHAPRNDLAGSLALGQRIVREAAAAGADLVLFPEMWSTGYALPIDTSFATPVDGPWAVSYTHLTLPTNREV